jgi:hypothetical protein
MESLMALLLVTPIYGFSLTPPAIPQSLFASPLLVTEVETAPEVEGGAEAPAGGEDSAETEALAETGEPPPPEVSTSPEAQPAAPPAAATAAPESGDGSSFAQIAAEGARRQRLRNLHRAFGITTWVAMTAALTLGALQFADDYGAGSIGDTRCARGDPILGSTNCDVPYAHIIAISLTTAAYFTTFGLSFAMHDRNAPRTTIQTDHSRRLRMHRALRWVHFAGMVGQIVGGLIFANLDAMGVSKDQNYDTLRGLNIYHLVVGGVTWAALTWAGALFISG